MNEILIKRYKKRMSEDFVKVNEFIKNDEEKQRRVNEERNAAIESLSRQLHEQNLIKEKQMNEMEKNMSKETSTVERVLGSVVGPDPKAELELAGYLVASNELTLTLKEPMAAYFAASASSDSARQRELQRALSELLNSEAGEVVFQYMLAGVFQNVPIPGIPVRARLGVAKGCRVEAYKKVGTKVAQLLSGPMREALANAAESVVTTDQ
ncbi:hypothetical protein LCGC14_0941690 [marine sediment metagenome]|uniref:Uncharacterized protein n=1 Tax=marine sediment metagenome TaxID=412755 RepID=A0A0F9RR93_9ZZZZ